jgi:CDP-glucose 4,6-dehydratase
MFNDAYRDKKVLVTGNTGFKGSWLSAWLLKLGARVVGLSDKVPTEPALFAVARLADKVDHRVGDVRDLTLVKRLIDETRPDFIFHLAAQAIVSTAYEAPTDTISTNVVGTANILEALRDVDHGCTAVIITSDKCYENVEWPWGYRETDHLGGRDIYSGSKGAAEIIIHSYFHSFFSKADSKVRVATGRAGNVIGGGDWAKDRIVVDCMRNWSAGLAVNIRSPRSTRPWQHVLEPLSGYLTLGAALAESERLAGEAFNFGPRSEQNRTVLELLTDLSQYWQFSNPADAYRVTADIPFHEAGLLKLNCDKALLYLKWEPTLNYDECVRYVSEWYHGYYRGCKESFKMTIDQIQEYETRAAKRGLVWTKSAACRQS